MRSRHMNGFKDELQQNKNMKEQLNQQKIFEELRELKQNPTPSVTQKLRIQHLQQLLDK